MGPGKRWPLAGEDCAALIVVLARLGFCAYRAATQSITIDEAVTFERFVDGPWSRIYSQFDASNHVLYTALAKLTAGLFGVFEFSLRLPSLLAGALLLRGCYILLKRVRSRAVRWTAFLAVCLHPLLLDFCVAARGYSLSLALFVWALHMLLEARLTSSGLLLGLAMAANLSTVFPALALFCTFGILRPGTIRERIRSVRNLALPAAAVFVITCAASLWTARKDDFYLGYPTFRRALVDFVFTSIHAKIDQPGLFGTEKTAEWIVSWVLPVIAVISAIYSFRGDRNLADRFRLVPLLTIFITITGLICAHWLFDLNYPADRTCLYFLVLAAISWAFAADAMNNRALRYAWLVGGWIMMIQFATQVQGRYFQFWTVEADDKAIAHLIKRTCNGHADQSVSVSTTWTHQPSLEFYRRQLRIGALKPIVRYQETPLIGHDIYVLSGGDLARARASQLKTAFSDQLVGVVVLLSDNGLSSRRFGPGRSKSP